MNPQTLTNEQNQVTRYYYDDLSQLTSVEYQDGSSTDYTYDPVGNRTNANGTTYTYDTANRLTSAGGTTCSYDANGNLLTMGAKTYQYDYANRLAQFSDGINIAQYYYDGDGIRTGMTVAGAVYGNYEYIYDINAGIPNLLMERKDNQTIGQNIWGTSLLSRIGPDGQIYYLQDGLGSTSSIADMNGQLLNSYWYDAFGEPHTVAESVYNPFLFTGGYTDPSGLIYLNARYYDPITGRFLTQDTVMGDLLDPLSQNLYVYCSNNPVAYTDPSGNIKLCQWDELFKGIGFSAWDTVQELIKSPAAVRELINAIVSHKLTLKDFGSSMLDSMIKPWAYLINNSKQVWTGNVGDAQVLEYGRNLGTVIQQVAGLLTGGAGSVKVLSKVLSKFAKAIKNVDRIEEAGNLGRASVQSERLGMNLQMFASNGKRFTPDQQALVQLGKEAKKAGGVTDAEAKTLMDWADEYSLQGSHGPEAHPNRPNPVSKAPHIHLGPVDHIPVN